MRSHCSYTYTYVLCVEAQKTFFFKRIGAASCLAGSISHTIPINNMNRRLLRLFLQTLNCRPAGPLSFSKGYKGTFGARFSQR
jgi:hypothetical protein